MVLQGPFSPQSCVSIGTDFSGIFTVKMIPLHQFFEVHDETFYKYSLNPSREGVGPNGLSYRHPVPASGGPHAGTPGRRFWVENL